MTKMILITGATGHFGKAIIDFLLQKGINPNQISALVGTASLHNGLAPSIDVMHGALNKEAGLIRLLVT